MSISQTLISQFTTIPTLIRENDVQDKVVVKTSVIRKSLSPGSGINPLGVGEKSGEQRSGYCHVEILVSGIDAFRIET